MLTVLEGALRRDYLSSNFETTVELLKSDTQDFADQNSIAHPGSAVVLPWVPNTAAAVTLRLLDLDSAVSYTLDQKAGLVKEREAGDFIVSLLPYDYCINIFTVVACFAGNRCYFRSLILFGYKAAKMTTIYGSLSR